MDPNKLLFDFTAEGHNCSRHERCTIHCLRHWSSPATQKMPTATTCQPTKKGYLQYTKSVGLSLVSLWKLQFLDIVHSWTTPTLQHIFGLGKTHLHFIHCIHFVWLGVHAPHPIPIPFPFPSTSRCFQIGWPKAVPPGDRHSTPPKISWVEPASPRGLRICRHKWFRDVQSFWQIMNVTNTCHLSYLQSTISTISLSLFMAICLW